MTKRWLPALLPVSRAKGLNLRGQSRSLGGCNRAGSFDSRIARVYWRQSMLGESKPADRLFPNEFKKMFNGLLTDANLKFDRNGKARTAYSLRHSYICFRLLEGADIYQVAKNCRTSVEMIEKHYAAHLKDMIDTSLVNVRTDKPRGRAHATKEGQAGRRVEA